MSVVMASFSNDENVRLPALLKNGFHHIHFNLPSPQISEQLLLRTPVKGGYCFLKSILFKSMLVKRLRMKYTHDSIFQKALPLK